MNRIIKPLFQPKRTLYTIPDFSSKYTEYIQFAISGTNCLLIVSILGFMEQYNEKMKIINECNNSLRLLLKECNKNNKSQNSLIISIDENNNG
jgi:hypothetical protein